MMRELTGATFTAVECYDESLSKVLAEAASVIAAQEVRHPRTGLMYHDRGAARIHHAEHEDGHQLIITFEES